MNIPEIIKSIRKQKHYTQKDIASYLNLAQTSYSDIENGIARLTVEDYLKICKFLEIDPIALVKDSNSVIISITEEEAKILNRLNDKVQQSFSLNNVNINTSGDVIIGTNIKNK